MKAAAISSFINHAPALAFRALIRRPGKLVRMAGQVSIAGRRSASALCHGFGQDREFFPISFGT
jgi:hypothetical protein